MPRFRFKLDPVLETRRRAEQAKQRVVADLDRRRLEMEETLRRRQAAITAGKDSRRDQLVGRLDIAALRAHAGSTLQVIRDAHRILLELAGVHKQLDAARAELIEASRDRRAIELLRERRFEEWKKRVNKAEDAVIDELAVQSAARSRPRDAP
jgi:flagellar FliJ protein